MGQVSSTDTQRQGSLPPSPPALGFCFRQQCAVGLGKISPPLCVPPQIQCMSRVAGTEAQMLSWTAVNLKESTGRPAKTLTCKPKLTIQRDK